MTTQAASSRRKRQSRQSEEVCRSAMRPSAVRAVTAYSISGRKPSKQKNCVQRKSALNAIFLERTAVIRFPFGFSQPHQIKYRAARKHNRSRAPRKGFGIKHTVLPQRFCKYGHGQHAGQQLDHTVGRGQSRVTQSLHHRLGEVHRIKHGKSHAHDPEKTHADGH